MAVLVLQTVQEVLIHDAMGVHAKAAWASTSIAVRADWVAWVSACSACLRFATPLNSSMLHIANLSSRVRAWERSFLEVYSTLSCSEMDTVFVKLA